MFPEFQIRDDLIKMVSENLTNNADYSESSSFQIEHHEGNDENSYIMFDEYVTNLTLNGNISNEDFEFSQRRNAYFKN